MTVAPHFDLDELLRSDSHPELAAKPIDLAPEVLVRLCRLTWEVLVPLRERFGPVIITSGFRSRALNEAVNGASDSRHLTGCAVDFTLSRFSPTKAWDEITAGKVRATWDRMAWYPGKDRFHTDIADDGSPGRGLLYVHQRGGWRPA